jgi:hypothetical protein
LTILGGAAAPPASGWQEPCQAPVARRQIIPEGCRNIARGRLRPLESRPEEFQPQRGCGWPEPLPRCGRAQSDHPGGMSEHSQGSFTTPGKPPHRIPTPAGSWMAWRRHRARISSCLPWRPVFEPGARRAIGQCPAGSRY